MKYQASYKDLIDTGDCFSGNYLLSFHLGWENQYWWSQLEARLLTAYQPNGDLTYSGIDAGIRFDF